MDEGPILRVLILKRAMNTGGIVNDSLIINHRGKGLDDL